MYWYNGVLVSSEIVRGLDIFELTPSAFISQNEIDAAKTVHLDYLNAQGQPKLVWPPSFALTRAYLDQLERTKGLGETRIGATRAELGSAERAPAAERSKRLSWLATQLNGYALGSTNGAKVKTLGSVVRDLSAMSR